MCRVSSRLSAVSDRSVLSSFSLLSLQEGVRRGFTPSDPSLVPFLPFFPSFPMALPIRVASAAKGVTTVIERCEGAKATGYLDLSSCSLMYLADAIYLVLKGYEVNKVNLRDNDLKKFPKKLVSKFPNMTIVNAEGNQIEEIPEEFAEWKQLRGLNMANNKLTSFAYSLYSLESLAVMDISGNAIEEIDVDRFFSSFPKLIQLKISGNPLKSEIKAALSEKRPKTMTIQF